MVNHTGGLLKETHVKNIIFKLLVNCLPTELAWFAHELIVYTAGNDYDFIFHGFGSSQ